MLELRLLDKDHQHHAHKGKHRGQLTHIQGNEQAGNRGTNVGAHDDPDRLAQSHHPGVYKAYHHHCGSGGGLDDSGDGRTHQHAQKAVGGKPLQNTLHPCAGGSLQAGTHHLHPMQKQCQAAQQPQYF